MKVHTDDFAEVFFEVFFLVTPANSTGAFLLLFGGMQRGGKQVK
jgi:hypothetical protein